MPQIKNVLEFSLEIHKYRPPVTGETTQAKALEDATFVNITWQDIKPDNRRATSLVHSKGFAPSQW